MLPQNGAKALIRLRVITTRTSRTMLKVPLHRMQRVKLAETYKINRVIIEHTDKIYQ